MGGAPTDFWKRRWGADMVGCLANKVAIVTGGAGGIGKAIAMRIFAEGARVIAVGHKEPVSLLDAGNSLFRADVSLANHVAAFFTHVLKQYGRADVLVNSAGIELIPILAHVARQSTSFLPLCADVVSC